MDPASIRIATLGDNCVDRYVDGTGAPGSDYAGGNAINVAVWLRALGYPASYYGFVGDDPEGAFLREQAARWGVDVSGVRVRPGKSGITLLQIDASGERRFLSEEYGVAADFGLAAVARDDLDEVAWIHAARLADSDGLDRFRADGIGVSYDFTDEWDDDALDRICPALDVAFFSVDEDPDAEPAIAIGRDAVRRGAGLGIVTRGVLGSVAADRDEVWLQEAMPVEVSDTLGAGDAFIAGFIAAVLQDREIAEALRRASEEGARACTAPGAWPPPPEDEIGSGPGPTVGARP